MTRRCGSEPIFGIEPRASIGAHLLEPADHFSMMLDTVWSVGSAEAGLEWIAVLTASATISV